MGTRKKRITLATTAAAVALVSGCGSFGPPQADIPRAVGCEPNVPSTVNPDETVSYDPDHMLCVHVDMDANDFQLLRNEEREIADVFFGNCDEPFSSPFHWYGATVTIDGVTRENVGIRNKGFVGSVNPQKPSIKFKTDKFVGAQTFGDTDRITLNNSASDATRVKTCLAFSIFERAGIAAPRCNMANVVINGEPFGAYVHVEQVKKEFLRRAFNNDHGHLYEATLTDFFEERLPRYEAETSDTDPSREPLRNVIRSLETSDDDFIDSISSVVNLDRFITYWAVEALIGHADGYAIMRNNHFVYFDPNDDGRAQFIPWGTDMVMEYQGLGGTGAPISGFNRGEIVRRLSRIEEGRKRFHDEVRRLLTEMWNVDVFTAEIDRLQKFVRISQQEERYDVHIDELKAFIRERREKVGVMLDEGGLAIGSENEVGCGPIPL